MNKLGPYLLGPNDTPENGIYLGDARELAKAIPDESVDLIFTDPMYDRIDDYRWLAGMAARVLVNGGNLMAQCGNLHRYEAESAMRESTLLPLPLLCESYPFSRGQIFKDKVIVRWKPYIWMSKGARSGGWVFNGYNVKGRRDKSLHKWGDSTRFFIEYITRLTINTTIILDPFTGGGTVPAVCKMLGRKYLAFEIDSNTL